MEISTDRIKFECYACGAILDSFDAYDAHIGEHLRAQAAPDPERGFRGLRTLRRTVRANKIMIAKSDRQENADANYNLPNLWGSH